MVPLSAFQKKKSRILRQMSLIPRNLKKMSHAADVPRRPRPTQPKGSKGGPKAKPKGREKAKDSKVSDNGRAVNTEYYHHASYSLMPDPNLIYQKH